jgi:hypothetical protein
MKKKVIRGWVSRTCATPGDVIGWGNVLDEELVAGPFPVFRLKKHFSFATPKKVKITIELED